MNKNSKISVKELLNTKDIALRDMAERIHDSIKALKSSENIELSFADISSVSSAFIQEIKSIGNECDKQNIKLTLTFNNDDLKKLFDVVSIHELKAYRPELVPIHVDDLSSADWF